MSATVSSKIIHPDARTGVELLIGEAVRQRASDLHLEPTADGVHIQLRVDGLLRTHQTVDHETGQGLINRFMVAAKLLTYRRDIPQEGRCVVAGMQAGESPADSTHTHAGELDLRVSVMPTNHGLRVAVRLPAELLQPRTLDALGLPDEVMAGLADYASADSGMLLLTGPAGSGKTTTIYALLEMIRQTTEGLSIVALEDPIERDLSGITQIQVTPFGELTYERALRSMLRQDPQVLALGEIRDAATASVAVQAALSGHRLLSTLHAASPAGAVVRLLEMGLERYQITGALWGVVSMRLLRRSDGSGGYDGRVPVASLARITPDVRDAIVAARPLPDIEAMMENQSAYTPLSQAAQQLIDRGFTDTAEVERVLGAG